jgi:GTP cyclohydrolase IA
MSLDLMTASESITDCDSYSFDEQLTETSHAAESSNRPAAESKRPVDKTAIEAAVRAILEAVGEDAARDGLLDTPARVARMYEEMFSGLHLDPARHLETTFPEDYDEIVLVRDIPFTSMCEHHLLPFTGVAHVGYLPNGRVVGLSKLARVVEEVARRPQVQERMTQTVADMLEDKLGTKGAAVVIESEHSCMALRGVRKSGTLTVTSSLRGIFRTSPASRAEVLSLINRR